jgi:hypothetical protein
VSRWSEWRDTDDIGHRVELHRRREGVRSGVGAGVLREIKPGYSAFVTTVGDDEDGEPATFYGPHDLADGADRLDALGVTFRRVKVGFDVCVWCNTRVFGEIPVEWKGGRYWEPKPLPEMRREHAAALRHIDELNPTLRRIR